jgi:hypothetical protein
MIDYHRHNIQPHNFLFLLYFMDTVQLPQAPQTASPVPHLTSIHSTPVRGQYGDARYPGNCSGQIIKDLLLFFQPKRVFDPMTGSGTCADVCKELKLFCKSGDVRTGFDAADPSGYHEGPYDFIWLHPPYWKMKIYRSYAVVFACPSIPCELRAAW